MMTKKIICVAILILTGLVATAQTISLEFPYFAGKTYEFKIVQGGKHIVLQNDTIPTDGKVKLHIPLKYKGYKGMAMWYLTNSQKGGGLEMVINSEDFSVTCLDSVPTTESIVYKNTLENTFLFSNYQEQQNIFAQHDAMLYAKRAYQKEHSLYPVFASEYDAILKRYTQFIESLKDTPLYAARFREITNITMGIGSLITQDENLKAQNINNIIVNKMDFEVLYTSNHWAGIINSFVQLHSMVLKNDARFTADAKTILNRMPTTALYTDFVADLTKALTKAGKDNIITALTPQIKNANKLLNYDGVLSVYQKDLSGKAPNLIVSEPKADTPNSKKENTVIDFGELKNKYTLLVFYKSDCGPCDDLLNGLINNYKNLTAMGIEIITVAADTEEAVFKNSVAQPWAKKYCDFKGANGINFKNYAVVGTPTLYLLNEKGIIIQKMHGLQELLMFTSNDSR